MGFTGVLPATRNQRGFDSELNKGTIKREAELIMIADGGRIFKFPVRFKPMLIGRANNIDQEMFEKHLSLGPILDHKNASVDRIIMPDLPLTKNISSYGHCKIVWKLLQKDNRNIYHWICELQDTSTNGTIVNKEKVHLGKKELVNRSHIEIGIYKFQIIYS